MFLMARLVIYECFFFFVFLLLCFQPGCPPAVQTDDDDSEILFSLNWFLFSLNSIRAFCVVASAVTNWVELFCARSHPISILPL